MKLKIAALIVLFPGTVAWPICAAYLYYLGFSRNEWLDGLFLDWEGISFVLLAVWFLCCPIFGMIALETLEYRISQDEKR